jgi:hypothetical protein
VYWWCYLMHRGFTRPFRAKMTCLTCLRDYSVAQFDQIDNRGRRIRRETHDGKGIVKRLLRQDSIG